VRNTIVKITNPFFFLLWHTLHIDPANHTLTRGLQTAKALYKMSCLEYI